VPNLPPDMVPWLLVGLVVTFANGLAFALFGIDKGLARAGRRRISEGTLLICALVGGYLGAKAGQQVFRHKTRKQPFRSTLDLIGAVQAGVVIAMIVPQSRAWLLGQIGLG